MKKNSELEDLRAEVEKKTSELEKVREQLHDLEGNRRAMLYMLEDLNEATTDIEMAKREWEQTFDAISAPIFIHDSKFKIVRANRAYMEAAGMPFEEIIGRACNEVFPVMDEPFRACKKGLELRGREEEVSLPDKVYRVRSYPVINAQSGHYNSIRILEDITEAKEKEERKRILDSFNQRVIANLDTGYRYQELCKAVTELGYKMVWVGELNNGTKEVVPVAEDGFEDDYLSTIKVKFDDSPLGEGPTGMAVKMKRPQVQNDIANDPKYKPWREAAQKRGYGSSAAFPMIIGNNVIGVLNVYHDGDIFPETDVDFLHDFAHRTAVYIRNALLFKELTDSKNKIRQEMDITSDLLMIAEAASGKTDLDKLMEEVANCCQRLMKSDICLSYIFDQDANVFKPSRAAGLSHEEAPLFRTEPLAKDIWFVKEAIVAKRACCISASLERTGLQGKSSTSGALKWIKGLTKVLVIPLVGRAGPVGIILAIYMNKKEFTERDYDIVDGMSRQVATALEEARLYRDSIDKALDLSHKIETIRVMHEIDKSILSVLDRNELLETVVGLVEKVVPCDRSIAFLVDKEKKGFVYIAGGDEEASKMEFIPFAETIAEEVVKTHRPQILPDLRKIEKLLPEDVRCVERGWHSVIRYPLIVKGEVSALLCISSDRTAAFTPNDLSTLEKLASQICVAMENSKLVSDLEDLFIGTVKSLSSAIDAKSPWTAGHSERVTSYALLLGQEMGLSDEELKDLELAGLLHDVGKIGTYEEILDKPGKLTDEEFEAVKKHPAKGADMLAPIKQLKHILPAIRHHHENYDGTGYPDGLKGESIPFLARILAVADTYDAMKADRPYRTGRTMKFIAGEFGRCSGTQFDPKVVNVFLDILGGTGIPAEKVKRKKGESM